MAVAFEGFSIREYTAKMRSVDVVKCWPFSEKVNKEEVEKLLPPIAVSKFRWWSHELRHMRSTRGDCEAERTLVLCPRLEEKSPSASADDKSEMVCPVCRVFAAATVNAVNAHIDDCLAAQSPPTPPPSSSKGAENRRQIIRNCSSLKAAKAKSKPTKKRSITEIFAVAPQIEAVEDFSDGNEGSSEISEQEEEEEEEGDGDKDEAVVDDFEVLTHHVISSSRSSAAPTIKAKMKKSKKRKKEKKRVLLEENNSKDDSNNSVGVLSKLMENKKKLNKKKTTKKIKVDGSSNIATKGNAQKFKLQNHVNFAKRLKKRFAMDVLNSDSVCRKKTSVKCLSQDKQNVVEPSILITRSQEPTFPIRSILKNHTSCEQKSTIHNAQCGSEVNPCGTQLSERHVRFSGKDDILGPKKNDFCSSEQNVRNLLSDALTASSEKVQSADSRTVAMEVNRSKDDNSVGTNSGNEVQTIFGRGQLADIPRIEIPSSPRLHITIQDKMKFIPEKSTVPRSQGALYDNNLHMFDQGYPTASLKPALAGIPRIFSTLGGSCADTQVGGNVSRTFNSGGKLIDHVLDPIHRVAEITRMEDTSPFSEPLSGFTANENGNCRLQFQSQPSEERVNGHALRYQSFCRLPPMDFIGGLCSFPEWKQQAVALRERSRDEDFFGLPLNSQGELIQSSSRGKGMYNQLRETNISGPSSSFFPARNLSQPRSTGDYLSVTNKHSVEREFPNDRVNLFLAQNYVKENHNLQVPARLGVTYWESKGRADIHQIDFERSNCSFRPLDADLNLMNFSYDGSRQYDQMQNQKINEIIRPKEHSGRKSLNTSQPTMRLMGKDVAIGKSSKDLQGVEDGKVWTDKEIIVEHIPLGTDLDNSSLKRNFQEWIPQITSGKHKETAAQSLGIHDDMCAQNKLLLEAPGSHFLYPYHEWQTNASFQSSSLAADRNPSSNLLPFAHLPTSSTIFNRTPNFQDFFISEAESLRLGSQLPVLSTPQNSCEHVHWRPAELTHRPNLPVHFAKQGFEFPFLNPDSRVNVQSSWFQNSKSLPTWLLHATQQGKTPMISSQPITNAVSKQHQHISSRTNILNTPSVYHSAEATSYSCNPGTSHSQAKTSLGSATIVLPPLVPVISGVKPASAINTGYRNRMKVKERMKSKALGIKDLYPCKKTNKRLGTKSVDLVNPTRILDSEKQATMSALTRCTENPNVEMQCDMVVDDFHLNRYYSTEAQTDEIRGSGNEFPRVEYGMARSGPIKLRAGAKHILKPNQNMDPENFMMPIHSTIPFAPATNVSKVPESQNKSTKIYRF